MFPRRVYVGVALATGLLSMHLASSAQQSVAPGVQNRLSDLFSSSKEEELLEPDLAFKFKTSFKSPTVLIAELTPANGYYLYRERIKFVLKNTSGVAIRAVKLPTGEIKTDQFYGRTETYKKPIQAEIILDRAPNAKSFTLVAGYQGCHEKKGVCYPPMDKELTLALP